MNLKMPKKTISSLGNLEYTIKEGKIGKIILSAFLLGISTYFLYQQFILGTNYELVSRSNPSDRGMPINPLVILFFGVCLIIIGVMSVISLFGNKYIEIYEYGVIVNGTELLYSEVQEIRLVFQQAGATIVFVTESQNYVYKAIFSFKPKSKAVIKEVSSFLEASKLEPV